MMRDDREQPESAAARHEWSRIGSRRKPASATSHPAAADRLAKMVLIRRSTMLADHIKSEVGPAVQEESRNQFASASSATTTSVQVQQQQQNMNETSLIDECELHEREWSQQEQWGRQQQAALMHPTDTATFFGHMDARIEAIFKNRNDSLQRQRRAKRKVKTLVPGNCGTSGTASESDSTAQKLFVGTHSSYRAAQEVRGAKRAPRSRPDGQLAYPLPKINDHYITEIDRLLFSIPQHWSIGHYVNIDRALVHIKFAYGEFEQVQRVIQQMSSADYSGRPVPKLVVSELEDLWYLSLYPLSKLWQDSGAPSASDHPHYQCAPPPSNLSAVQRYRIRKKYPCPFETDESDRKRYKISQRARKLMTELYENDHYPTTTVKARIAHDLGLTVDQINNWFKNRRQRSKTAGSSKRSTPILAAATSIKSEKSPSANQCYITTTSLNNDFVCNQLCWPYPGATSCSSSYTSDTKESGEIYAATACIKYTPTDNRYQMFDDL